MRNRKIVVYILIFVLVINSFAYSFVYLLSNPLVRSVIAKNGSTFVKNYAIPAVLGSGLAYLVYNSVNSVFKEKNVDSLTVNDFKSSSTVPAKISYNGSFFDLTSSLTGYRNCAYQPYNFTYSSGQILIDICPTQGGFMIDGVSRCQGGATNGLYGDCVRYVYSKNTQQTQATLESMTYSSVSVQNSLDNNTVILPLTLDLTKNIADNVNSIQNSLANNNTYKDVANTATPESVADMLANLPTAYTQQMPLSVADQHLINQQAIEQLRQLDNATNAEAVRIQDVEIPSIPDLPSLPGLPVFDTNLNLPETKDFLLPVKNFFNNFLSSLPFLSLLRDAKINVSNQFSKITFNLFNNTIEYDFNNFNNIFSFMSDVLIFVASVLAVFIIIV